MTEVMQTAWGNPSCAAPARRDRPRVTSTPRAARMLAALGDRGRQAATSCGRAAAASPTRSRCSAPRARTPGAIVISTLEHPAISTLADRLAAEGREVVRVAPGRDGVARSRRGRATRPRAPASSRSSWCRTRSASSSRSPRSPPRFAPSRPTRPHPRRRRAGARQGRARRRRRSASTRSRSPATSCTAPRAPARCGSRSRRRIEPLWVGGGQQKGLRGGTQDAPGAAGLGLAAERAVASLATARTRWLELAGRVTRILDRARRRSSASSCPTPARAAHPRARHRGRSCERAAHRARRAAASTSRRARRAPTATSKASPALEAIGLPADHGMVRLSFALDTTARRRRAPRRRSSPTSRSSCARRASDGNAQTSSA